MDADGKQYPSPSHAELLYSSADLRWYVCQVCGNTFDNRYALMGHMNAHRKQQQQPVVRRCIRLFGVDIVVVEAGAEGE